MNPKLKFALDMGPLLVFFLAYRMADLLTATAALIVFTLVSLAITYAYEKKIAVMPLVSAIAVTVFGGMTLILHDELFIKMKPTIVNLLFSSILLGGLYFGRPMLKYLLAEAISLTETGWRKLSRNWGLYFIFLAALNEVIWRNFSTDFWVNFKVFGMFTCTLLFTTSQIPLMKKEWVEEEKKDVG
ncbi:MAG: septation protein A [Alphaproteobacteria bacterium]|nr:septation protein A [Alphaproteobacteria bacterium]